MQKLTNKKFATGIVLLLCLPISVIVLGLNAFFAPQWYFSSAFVEMNNATFADVDYAFREIAKGSPDIALSRVRNTDLVSVTARDNDSQTAAQKANSAAATLQQKLHKAGSEFPSIFVRAEPTALSVHRSVPLNMIVGAVLGFVPALMGLILIFSGSRNRLPNSSAVHQSA